jgi:tripartite-type tricarboxylate transporter receptor subunit TctC
MSRRSFLGAIIAGSLALVMHSGDAAAQYPTRPITIIVPFAAGGPADVLSRLLGAHMANTLGQQFVIENVGGAGGTLGMTRVATAAPDGYTIGVGNMGTQSAAPAVHAGLRYDPVTSFTQIGIVNFTPQMIVARRTMAANTLAEFMAFLKTNSETMNYGHAGPGSIAHVSGALFNHQFGFKPTQVTYRGTGPAMNDLVAGHIDYIIDQSTNTIPQIQAGTIKAYAVAHPTRLAALPNVPTTRELGIDFVFSAWNAMVGPAGMPKEATDRLIDALNKAIDDPAIQRRYVDLGSTAPQGAERGPAGLTRLLTSEMARIRPAIQAVAGGRSVERN